MTKKRVDEKQGFFETLLARYKQAWESREPNLALELFTPDATYREDPFDRRPLRGLHEIRQYWAEVPKHQRDIAFSYGPVFHSSDSRVWGAEWEAQYTKIRTGKRIRLKGVLFCELFGRKIRRFWEYWHIKGGTRSFRSKVGTATRRK